MSQPTTQVLTWVDEVPKSRYKRTRYDWDAIAREVRARPGEWACVLIQQPKTVATAIRRERMTALRPVDGRYEVRTRNQHDGLADIYMRFVPNDSEENE